MSPATRRTFLLSLTGLAAPDLGTVAARTVALPPSSGETRQVTDDLLPVPAAALTVLADCALEPGTFAPMPVGQSGYAALPTITRLPPSPFEPHRPGPLRVVWFAGQDHLSYGTATLMTSLSDDHGGTWSAPQAYPWANSLRDPGLSTIGDRVWLSYFTGTTANPGSGVYVRDSRDGGETFGMPRRVDPYTHRAASSAPLRQVGDQLAMPWYGRLAHQTHHSAWVSVLPRGSNTWTPHLVADGQQDGRDYSEPWLLVDHPDPGTLLPRLRVWHRYGIRDRIGLTESVDGGQTWVTRPLFAGFGKPAAVRMSTGHLVVVYRSAADSSAVYAVSTDDGATWTDGHPLMANTAGTDLGMVYAAPYEVTPGRLYVVVAMETAGGAGARLHHGYLACA